MRLLTRNQTDIQLVISEQNTWMASVSGGTTALGGATNIFITPQTSSIPSQHSHSHSHSHPHRGSSRTRRKPWRKLLWVKQNYPDNWVDSTFLSQLQRNINVQPYNFWSLVAESTVIVQHLSTVVIFVMCFIAIFTDRFSPVMVAGGGSALTVVGYLLWNVGWEVREAETRRGRPTEERPYVSAASTAVSTAVSTPSHSPTRKRDVWRQPSPLGIKLQPATSSSPRPNDDPYLQIPSASRSSSRSRTAHSTPEIVTPIPRYRHALSLEGNMSRTSSVQHSPPPKPGLPAARSLDSVQNSPHGKGISGIDSRATNRSTVAKGKKGAGGEGDKHASRDSVDKGDRGALDFKRKQQQLRRLQTAKSAILIYCVLMGLSPILRSLTESISSDSIWAIATWLFLANCLSFDYGSDISVRFPASLSTNAAIMASVVLASRLPTTTHVFCLVLFSIEMFGLFPVFRRFVRHVSWTGHVSLTVVLVAGAAVGLGEMVGWGWAWGWVGLMGPGIMGGCSWWLMWLQQYKNEIHGPWDPAKPVIRGQWKG